MAFIIDRDLLSILLDDGTGDEGTFGPRAIPATVIRALQSGEGERFRMLDDDGEVYYLGRFINGTDAEDEFQPLDCFGTPNAGCTAIQYWQTGKDGGWKTL